MPLERLSALAAAGLLLAACGSRPASTPSTARAGDGATVTVAVAADITALFPNGGQNDVTTAAYNASIFQGLVALDPQLRLRPALAERWENPDDRTYVFTLRPDARFSDGSPVTAGDVAASLNAVHPRGWETRDYLQALDSARALDDRRVEVRTHAVSLGFLTRLPWGYVLPARVLDQRPVPALGSGPYVIEGRQPGRELVLRRNFHHAGPRPAFERARFVVIPDAARRVELVRHGQADVAAHVPPELAAQLAGPPGPRALRHTGAETLYLALRVDRPPFSDVRVREAFDLALDRAELVRRTLPGGAQAASQLVPPTILGHARDIRAPRLDRARARQLLAEAGFAAGLKLRLDGPANRYAGDLAILDELARQLATVGVRVEVNAQPKGRFYELIDSGASSAHLLGWTCLSGDAGDVLEALLHSRDASGLGLWNTLGLADAELDRLIERAGRAVSDGERGEALRAASARVAELRAVLPLLRPDEIFAVSPRLDWTPPLDGALRPAEMRPAAP